MTTLGFHWQNRSVQFGCRPVTPSHTAHSHEVQNLESEGFRVLSSGFLQPAGPSLGLWVSLSHCDTREPGDLHPVSIAELDGCPSTPVSKQSP